jgi:hypothetical protein
LTAADDFGYEIDEAEVITGRSPESVGASSVSRDGRRRTGSVRHELSSQALDPEQPPSIATSH